jgi:pimeloyl-ACP methyl ester carboxylesterase
MIPFFLAQAAITMPRLTLSPALSLNYLDPNPTHAPAVVLLHGFGGAGDSWQDQCARLAQAGFRPIAPDLRGFGQSSFPGHCSIPEMAQDIAELLRRTGAAPAAVVGISMGGTVALQLTLDSPELVRRLVLVNTFARLRPQGLRGWCYFLLRFAILHTLGLPAQARLVARRMFPRPDQQEARETLYRQIIQSDPRAYRQVMRALGRFDVECRLADIRVPTLVITGARDTTIAPRNQQPLLDRIPGARRVILAEANHAAPTDAPEAFARALEDFLREDETTTGTTP